MTSRPRSLSSLRRFTRQFPTPDEIRTILGELTDLNHRATAIIGATLLERALEALLKAHFVPDDADHKKLFDNPNAPLSGFSAKIELTYAMGFTGPITRDDLNRIRTVRNAFAHSLRPINFNTQEVGSICKLLQFPDCLSPRRRPGELVAQHPRQLFLAAVESLWDALMKMAKADYERVIKERQANPRTLGLP